MKYLFALWLAVTAPLVYATCTTSSYCGPNGCVFRIIDKLTLYLRNDLRRESNAGGELWSVHPKSL